MTNPSTLILLHGAGLGSWVWDRVMPYLDRPAIAWDLPGRNNKVPAGKVTLAGSVAALEKLVAHTPGQVVLVAHSFSGALAATAAKDLPSKVAGIAFVGAAVARSGASFLSIMPWQQRLKLNMRLARSKDGVHLPAGLVRDDYCNDLDEPTTKLVLSKLAPEAPRYYQDETDWSPLPSATVRMYIKLTKDRSAPPQLQDEVAERVMATKAEEISSGHLPMLSRPKELAEILNTLTVH